VLPRGGNKTNQRYPWKRKLAEVLRKKWSTKLRPTKNEKGRVCVIVGGSLKGSEVHAGPEEIARGSSMVEGTKRGYVSSPQPKM